MEAFKINCIESGKVITLVSGVEQVVTIMNVVQINTDNSVFTHSAETGEITILRNSYIECNGKMYLINTDDETPNLSIYLNVNGVRKYTMFTGLPYTKVLAENQFSVLANDVITISILSEDDIDVETTDDENYFIINRFMK